jgi:acylphosphatase
MAAKMVNLDAMALKRQVKLQSCNVEIQAILLIAEKSGTGERFAMSAADKVHHKTAFFSGRVQGVGFRYTTVQLARSYDVAGCVENLADGRVRVEVEGETQEVDGFLAALEERMQGYVRQVDKEAGERPRQFGGFTIR